MNVDTFMDTLWHLSTSFIKTLKHVKREDWELQVVNRNVELNNFYSYRKHKNMQDSQIGQAG